MPKRNRLEAYFLGPLGIGPDADRVALAAGQAFWLGRAVSTDPAGKEWPAGYEVVANLSFAAYEVLPNVIISTLAQSAVQVH